MKTGDKVRCINIDANGELKINDIYTIDRNHISSACLDDDTLISLKEVEGVFLKSRFLPLKVETEIKCLFVEQGSISTIRLPSGDMAIRDPHNISIIDNRDLNDLFDCLCKMYPDLLKRVDK